MSSTSERFRTTTAGLGRRIEGCPAGAADLETPCEGWVVSDLLAHVFDMLDLVLGPTGRVVVDDGAAAPIERWHRRVEVVAEVLEDPELASRPVASPVGTLALKQVVGGVILHDLLVHTWDLAVATGQDDQLDEGLVVSALEKMTPFDEVLRGPGMFGAKVVPPADADVQTRFLCFVGRDPEAWARRSEPGSM